MPHYRVVNISKKPGVKKGQHMQGVHVALGDNRPIAPGGENIVTQINPGILRMQQKGLISIEPVKDIHQIIEDQMKVNEKIAKEAEEKRVKELVNEKKLALEDAKESLSRPVGEEFTNLSTGLDKDNMKEKAKRSRGKVTAAKVNGPNNDPLDGLEEAMNPDGEPNFVVKAKRKRK